MVHWIIVVIQKSYMPRKVISFLSLFQDRQTDGLLDQIKLCVKNQKMRKKERKKDKPFEQFSTQTLWVMSCCMQCNGIF